MVVCRNSISSEDLSKMIVHDYVENELTDKEIANKFGLSESTIRRRRLQQGVYSSKHTETGRKGELAVIRYLTKQGFKVKDMNIEDPLGPFDILVNGAVRVEVKSAVLNETYETWNFALFNRHISENNSLYIKIGPSKYRKEFFKTCDFVVLCGFHDVYLKKMTLFVVPSQDIPAKQSSISIYKDIITRWHNYQNKVDSIKRAVFKKMLLKGKEDPQC